MNRDTNAETSMLRSVPAGAGGQPAVQSAKGADGKVHRGVVLIADALPGLRLYAADIVRGLAGEDAEIYEAADGVTAVALARHLSPSLIIMDVAMPVINGIKAATQIWEHNPSTRILFWTQYHREIYIRDLGRIVPDQAIHGYVLKNQSDDKLKYAIELIWYHDNPYIDSEVRATVRPKNHRSQLSDREFEIMQDLAVGLTERAISKRRHISIRGVQCRAAALYGKLLPAAPGAGPGTAGGVPSAAGDLFNQRARMLFEAVRRGLIEPGLLADWEADLQSWLRTDTAGE